MIGFHLPSWLWIRYIESGSESIIGIGNFMTNIFRNARVLLCAFVVNASTYGVAQVQEAVTPAPPSPSAPPRSFGGGRLLSLVTNEGNFKSEFKSFSESYQASQGNSYNQTLKKGSEIIVMNARCADGIFGDKVTFSIYALSNDVAPLVKSFLDIPTLGQKMGDPERRALIGEVIRIVAISSPRKADCDPVPVALSMSTSEVLRLEVDDAQNPLVGPKFNDGFLYDNLMQSSRFNMVVKNMIPGEQRAFWERFGYNRFSTAQDALNSAVLLAGTKALIYNGTNFSIYRLGNFKSDYQAGDDQFDVFKTTPMPEGWKIVAIVSGAKFIKIYDPNVR
ncbi:MAG TPA: hypothetical protein VGB77_19290 [Abditibacteriaceae bacterium]|jgi:hypothetical protein